MNESIENKRLEFVNAELRAILGGLDNAIALAAMMTAECDSLKRDALRFRLGNLRAQTDTAITLAGGGK